MVRSSSKREMKKVEAVGEAEAEGSRAGCIFICGKATNLSSYSKLSFATLFTFYGKITHK